MQCLYIVAGLLCMCNGVYALTIPKSSLEVVRNEVAMSLKTAQDTRDQKLINKYVTELAELDKKIKKFEREWLEYRKSQLMVETPVIPAITAEISEIDALLKVHTP